MKNWRKALVGPGMSLLDAIKIIEDTPAKICLVVDDDRRLLGTVTDGDIRRGILRGLTLERPVSSVMNANPRRVPAGESAARVQAIMREAQIRQIPYVDAAGRVVGLAVLADTGDDRLDDHWVVLMAGGLGTRLRPFTETLPKPMLRVGDKPLLETIIESFRKCGFRKFYVSVNYKADVVVDHFGDGTGLGVTIRYLHETESLGTAGALSLIEERPERPLIVMNGDVLTSVDFRSLLDYHREHGATATMAVREYDVEVPFGVVRVDGHFIRGIDEKPVHRFFVNAGIYVIDPAVLDVFERNVAIDMPDVFQRLLDRGASLTVFPIREYWLDIGRIDDFQRAKSEYGRQF